MDNSDENNQLVPVADQINVSGLIFLSINNLSLILNSKFHLQTLSLQQSLTSNNVIRDDLVNTAVSFLLNPKIQNTTLSQKRGFLLNKGLNSDEIELAIERTLFSLSGNQDSLTSYHHNAQLNPLFYRPPTFWSVTRLITPSVLLIAGLIYGLYQLVEKFIKPLIYGQEACRSSIEIIRSELSYLRQSIKNLEENLIRVEENVKRNLEIELQQSRSQDYAGIAAINEMKSELTSMKSLMLNKDQFPLITKSNGQASIPEWQRPKEDQKKM